MKGLKMPKIIYNPNDFIWNGVTVSRLNIEDLQQALCAAIEHFEEVRVIQTKINDLVSWADSNE